MIKKEYEVNEFQVSLYITLRALYEDFGTALPTHIKKELKNFLNMVGEYLDIDRNYGDIMSDKYYRKVIYESDKQ